MIIRWTPTALGDIESVDAYVAVDNPETAAGIVDSTVSGIETLTRHPDLGRRGRVQGTRELIIAPYVVAYRVHKAAIEVLAILHGARRWPDSF